MLLLGTKSKITGKVTYEMKRLGEVKGIIKSC